MIESRFLWNFFAVSCEVVSDFLWRHKLYPTRLHCPWDFPGKSIGVGSHFPSPGYYPGPGIEPSSLALAGNPHLLQPSHQGSPWNFLMAYLFKCWWTVHLNQDYLVKGFLSCVPWGLFSLNLYRTDIFVLWSAQWNKSTNHGDEVLQQCQMVQKISRPFLSLPFFFQDWTNIFSSSHWFFKSHWISRLVKVLTSQDFMGWA